MNTLFLATVVGWYFVIFSLFLLLRHDHVKAIMSELLAHRGLFFILALFTLIIGLLLVASHNVWVNEWPVAITIFSWFVLIGGLIRLFFPEAAIKMGHSCLAHPHGLKITGILLLIFGLYLLSHVYYPQI